MKLVEKSFLMNEVSLIKQQFVVMFRTGFRTEQTLQRDAESTCGFCGSFPLAAHEILPVAHVLL